MVAAARASVAVTNLSSKTSTAIAVLFYFIKVTSIANIVSAVANPYTPWRTLSGMDVVYNGDMPLYFTGNASVIFTIHWQGKKKVLKCYTRHNPHLKAIYGNRFLPSELCVSDIMGRRYWVDCLLSDYIEGVTLHEKLCQTPTPAELHELATAFDSMACNILAKEYAHGDLKPENIIICPDGQMKAIDWDAAFVPALSGNTAQEIGTAAYQHPMRNMEFYDKHIDDYSIAYLSTMLHAYATQPEMARYYSQHHQPQQHPRDIYRTRLTYKHISNSSTAPDWLDSVLDMFSARCMARQYHIARMLRDNTPQLFSLKRVFTPIETLSTFDPDLIEANVWHGLWGYCNDKGWVIAPLFDECYDPKYGALQVRLGEYKHLMRSNGKIIVTVSASTRIKIRHSVAYLTAPNEDKPFKEIIL